MTPHAVLVRCYIGCLLKLLRNGTPCDPMHQCCLSVPLTVLRGPTLSELLDWSTITSLSMACVRVAFGPFKTVLAVCGLRHRPATQFCDEDMDRGILVANRKFANRIRRLHARLLSPHRCEARASALARCNTDINEHVHRAGDQPERFDHDVRAHDVGAVCGVPTPPATNAASLRVLPI